MKTIDFFHGYYKLEEPVFTTVRGAGRIDKHKVGERVQVSVMGVILFTAEIIGMEKKRLSDIPLEVLKKDGEFPHHEINSHRDFMGIVNSLRRFNKLQSIDDEVTIITIQRMANN